ncbi:MAG: hypothetical protein PUH39_07195, partial [Bacteroidales bacterium]|nr:hypothetical protein [Bacteroidales bacterium]
GNELTITDNNGESRLYRLKTVLDEAVEVELAEQKTGRKGAPAKYHEAQTLAFSDIKIAKPYIKI